MSIKGQRVMALSRKIFCDWGGTRLRAFLEEGSDIVDRRYGPGIGSLQKMTPIGALRSVVGPWFQAGSSPPLFLCGMVGSRSGLVEVPYITAPAGADLWAAQSTAFQDHEFDLTIAPGVRAVNCTKEPDVMRGEEAQIFGALADHPELAIGSHVMVLPGTHSKWVEVEGGTIMRIQSLITGELFALLRDRSSLLLAGATQGDFDGGFLAGVERATVGGIAESLFATRTSQLLLGHSREWAEDFLSGLLIGNEVHDVLPKMPLRVSLTIIGEPGLSTLYHRALAVHGLDARRLDGEQSAISGLRLLAERTCGGTS